MTNNVTATNDKNVFRCFGRTYLRTLESNRFYDITDCPPITDGHIDDCNGVFVDAELVSAEYVAEQVAQSESKIRLCLGGCGRTLRKKYRARNKTRIIKEFA